MKKLGLLFLLLAVSSLAYAQRLPENAVPSHYQLRFAPDLQTATFSGEETIDVQLAQPSSSITMNSAEIKIQEATVSSGKVTQIAKISLDEAKEQVTLTTEKPISSGAAKIAIKFTGILNDQLRGFYLSKSKVRNYATTQFEATDARRAFPSFDEPAFKATFDITLVVDRNDVAFSNGRQLSDTPGPGKTKHTLKFATTAKMSTYLVAMVAGDFVCQKGAVDGIDLRVCATPDKAPLLDFSLTATVHIVHFYNQYYGIKYPFGKLDQIGIPDFAAGAMENTAAITYRETALLVDEKTATTEQRKRVASVIAHEIAHQWFGDLVTMKWWDDIWLNEGFATWMSSKPLEAWKPEWHAELDDVADTQNALRLDALASTRAIRSAANTPADIAQLFDGIAYGKTAAVLRMIENYVGTEAFRKGVNNYLAKHQYSNTVAQDFWTEIAAASGKPIDKIMPTFVTQPGAPLISVKASCASGKTSIAISQQRLFIDPKLQEQGTNDLWQIPVCIKSASSTQCHVVTQKRQSISLNGCSPWSFANSGGVGYYRTAYERDAASTLGSHVEAALSEGERISFLGDEWALVSNGRQSVASYLALTEAFKEEKSRVVMQSMLRNIDFLHNRIITDADRPSFEAWVRGLLQPLAKQLGMKPVQGEEPEVASLRASVMGTLGQNGDQQMLAYAREVLNAYMQDPTTVPPSQVSLAFDLVAPTGDAVLYETFLAKTKTAQTPTEFYRYLNSLSNFRDPALVSRTLALALSPDVRNQDMPRILESEFANPAGREVALEFLKEHFDEIWKRMNGGLGGGLAGAVGDFCDPAKRDEAKQLFEQKKLPGSNRSLRLGVERANACINFKDHQGGNLTEWLKTQTKANGAD